MDMIKQWYSAVVMESSNVPIVLHCKFIVLWSLTTTQPVAMHSASVNPSTLGTGYAHAATPSHARGVAWSEMREAARLPSEWGCGHTPGAPQPKRR